MYGMWFDVCMSLHVHFRWGVALVREFFYGALLNLSWDPLSGTGRRRSDEAVIAKEGDMWP